MAAPRKYPEELRERAGRLVFESGRPIAHGCFTLLGQQAAWAHGHPNHSRFYARFQPAVDARNLELLDAFEGDLELEDVASDVSEAGHTSNR